jgi:asparagine synthase (glutamine-hydrolysing)
MCGIAGFLLLSNKGLTFDASDRLRRMISTLRHRGPDDTGIWTDGVCGLAHVRLSVLDLSSAGHQPMGSRDNRFWVSFNGEIYNFLEIRKELQALGYRFRSLTDTEILVYGFAAWGEDFIDRLRGMFAFALWDAANHRLMLVRDRFGKKPLFHARIGNVLLFASEIKAILAWPGVDRRPDLIAIDQYLSLQYVPAPRTAFAGIQKLPSAHALVAERKGSGWRVGPPEQYWRLTSPKHTRQGATVRQLKRELVDSLKEAVRLRLVSDVPLGAFLSGGLDSSAVVAMMTELGAGPVKTFSVGFRDENINELKFARVVADRYATDHDELIVEPDSGQILSKLAWHYGEPFADPAMIPTYFLSEFARRHVTVALNGDGGDEAFLGYGRYATCNLLSKFDWLPSWARRGTQALLSRVPNAFPQARLNQLASALASVDVKPSQRYAFTITYFMDYMKSDGYSDTMAQFLSRSALDLLDPYFEDAPSLVSGANWADIHTYLSDDLMVKVDVASMAHGLECRSPLLDHVFMEWAMTIPEKIKLSKGLTKALFKSAMQPYLPDQIIHRPKMGFNFPLAGWLRGELKEMAYDVLLREASTSRQIFKKDYVKRLLDDHVSGEANHSTRIYALLMLELWFSMWIDSSSIPVSS